MVQLSDDARDDAANAIGNRFDAAGANPEGSILARDATDTTTIATFRAAQGVLNPMFSTASGGSGTITLLGTPLVDNSADATGTVGMLRFRNRDDGEEFVVGVANDGSEDANMPDNSVNAGEVVRITAFTGTVPAGTP